MKPREKVNPRLLVTTLAMYRKAYDTLVKSQDFEDTEAKTYAMNNFQHYHSNLIQEGCAEVQGDFIKVWLPGPQVPGNSMPRYSLNQEGQVLYWNAQNQWEVVDLHEHLYLHEYQVAVTEVPSTSGRMMPAYVGLPAYYGGSVEPVIFCTNC